MSRGHLLCWHLEAHVLTLLAAVIILCVGATCKVMSLRPKYVLNLNKVSLRLSKIVEAIDFAAFSNIVCHVPSAE